MIGLIVLASDFNLVLWINRIPHIPQSHFYPTDVLKYIALVWMLFFLSGVFANNGRFSIGFGIAIAFLALILLFTYKEDVFTIDSVIFFLSLLYLGCFICSDKNEYTNMKFIWKFFFSRLFFGYVSFVVGFLWLNNCLTSLDAYLHCTLNSDIWYFVNGNVLILIGMLLMWASRDVFGLIFGLFTVILCALIILQLPTLILLFYGKEYIKIYYQNVCFHWSTILAVILYITVGIINVMTSKVVKEDSKGSISATSG